MVSIFYKVLMDKDSASGTAQPITLYVFITMVRSDGVCTIAVFKVEASSCEISNEFGNDECKDKG